MARRRFDDDHDDRYDDEFEPRPRKKSNSKPVIIVIVVVMVVLVLVGGLMVALLLPAVQKVRQAAARMKSSNNLKMIGLAMHDYNSSHGGLPPQAITDETGKPLLSWRVAILPYIEQENLYNQFHFDEPWDSPHNMSLAQTMPSVYVLPGTEDQAGPGKTYYQVISGKGALFAPPIQPKPILDPLSPPADRAIHGIKDGTSNTIMVVEAANAVPWTKPEDVPYSPGVAPTLGEHFTGGANVLFADGSVRFLRTSVGPQSLEAAITSDGGEQVFLD